MRERSRLAGKRSKPEGRDRETDVKAGTNRKVGERTAESKEGQKRRKLCCFFCNEEGHAFQTCKHWKQWVAEDPKRRKLCAKCTKGPHRTDACREAQGAFWGKTPIKTKKESVAALVTLSPTT